MVADIAPPWHFSHVFALPFELWFNIFFFFCCVEALGLLLWLQLKKQKGNVSFPSLMENYQKSYTVPNFWVNDYKLQDRVKESLIMVLSMEY